MEGTSDDGVMGLQEENKENERRKEKGKGKEVEIGRAHV